MEEKPLVSIGIPTYNRPEGLKRTLDYIVSQTYSNLEIVISNNASTDPMVDQVVSSYLKRDPRIKYFKQVTNIGAFLNFKFVLEKASGSYFMWAADDDWMNVNYIECCLNFLQANPEFASAYGQVVIRRPNGDFEKFDSKIDLLDSNAARRVISYFRYVTHNGCYYGLIRRPLLKNTILKNCIAGDWLLVAQLAFQGKYKIIETTNYNISLGGVSQTMDQLTQAFNMPPLTKAFPYFAVGLNIVRDIIWDAKTYRELGFIPRFNLARRCFFIIYRRYSVKREIQVNYKKYFKLKKEQLKAVIG